MDDMQQLGRRHIRLHSVRRECSCRLRRNFKYFRGSNLWRWCTRSMRESLDAVMISSSRLHNESCPLYSECEQENVLRLNLSYRGTLLAATVMATFTMTRGAGGCSISPGLSYSRVVPSDAPAFALLKIKINEMGPTKELQVCFDRRIRQLSRLYSEKEALPHDVDEYGNTVLHVSDGKVARGYPTTDNHKESLPYFPGRPLAS